MIRDFWQDNAYSLRSSEEDFWQAVYEKAFPNLIYTELCDDIEKQKQGIDRVLYLGNGNVLWVDEKKRERVYPDILLEHTSNVERGTPGWIEKDLSMDYMAYAFMPSRTCYLFPWPLLRRAWEIRKKNWLMLFPKVNARTRVGGAFYTTQSVAIPIDLLRTAVSEAAIIKV